MISLEKMAEAESQDEMCIFKKAHTLFFDACYVCQGFNYNCVSYQIQTKIIGENGENEEREDLIYLDEDGGN